MQTSSGYPPASRVGWELLGISRSSLANLEESASRVVAAQVAGLIALWTQLYTFEEALPKAFGWAAWSLLLISISWLGRLVTPRRLARFWDRCRIEGRLLRLKTASFDEDEEAQLIQDLGETLSAQIRNLRQGSHISIVLGLAALGAAAAGFVVDKAFYGG
jgi:hypothetical protein